MALAINTSKRKFHKLLDNLTNTSTSSLSTLPDKNASTTSLATSDEPPSKRSHLSTTTPPITTERPSTARSRPPTSTSERPRSVRLVGATGASSNVRPSTAYPPSSPPKTPNYAPHSRPAFLSRLQTFSDVRLWTPKPGALSEVAWAKRGWLCEGLNTVACKGGCEARVVIKLRPCRTDEEGVEIEGSEDMGVEVDEALIERYRDLIVDGHGESCLWRRAGCPDNIYRVPVNRALWAEGLRERYTSFAGMGADVPEVEACKIPMVEGASLSQLCVGTEEKYLRPSRTQMGDETGQAEEPEAAGKAVTETETETLSMVTLALALFGWSGEKTHGIAVLRCRDCFQRVGLWLYKAEKLKNDAARLDLNEEDLKLNLLTAHREHCPWKNAESQSNPPDSRWAGKAFWEMLQDDIVTQSRTSVEQSRGQGSPERTLGDENLPTRAKIEEHDKALKRRLDKVKRAWSTITRKKTVSIKRPPSS